MSARTAHIALVLTAAALAAPVMAQVDQLGRGTLGSLFLPRESRLVHYASTDPAGQNADFRAIVPGETLVLMDHEGAGIVRRWWATIAPRNHPEIQRHLIVRCYWDGEAEPSVEVPVSDFFGMGFGLWKDYVSLPLNMTSGGYNSYWPMPFKTGARITVENTASVPVTHFYYNLDVEAYDRLPDDVLHFHAQFRRTISAQDRPVTILETTGRGHYVGTLLAMQPLVGNHLGYLEGNQRIFIDGEEAPSIVGTGTEDYFSSGWYYDTGEYSAPYHGVTVKDEERGRINTYRWHIEDPIPFEQSLRFTIEHGGTNDAPGVEYTSVAYWYQTHPHPPFPPLPDDLMPQAGALVPEIEAEALVGRASATGGEVQVQEMDQFEGTWGGDAQLWWVEARPGDRLTLPLEAPAAGTYDLVGFFTRAQDYGIVRLHVNGEPLELLVDGFSPSVEPTGPLSFGPVPLRAGENELVIELIGKDVRSAGYADGYLVGVDGFLLRP